MFFRETQALREILSRHALRKGRFAKTRGALMKSKKKKKPTGIWRLSPSLRVFAKRSGARKKKLPCPRYTKGYPSAQRGSGLGQK
jgi:hypothetical protein